MRDTARACWPNCLRQFEKLLQHHCLICYGGFAVVWATSTEQLSCSSSRALDQFECFLEVTISSPALSCPSTQDNGIAVKCLGQQSSQ